MNETDDRPGQSGTLTTVCTYVEQNPIAAIVQSIAAGFVIGLIIRWLDRPASRKIDVKHKPDLEEAKFHLGSLLLPFLWPAWQKTRKTYGESAESIQEAV